MDGKSYSISAARARLPLLLRELEHGPPIQLTRHGRPVAVLLSVADYERLASGRTDLWSSIEEFRASYDARQVDADEVYDDVRDPSPGRGVDL